MTNLADLERVIEDAWEARDSLNGATTGPVREAVDAALDALDNGTARVAEKFKDEWLVHQWLKKAVLLSFRLNDMKPIEGGPGGAPWWDKVDSEIPRLGCRALSGRRLPCRARRHRPPLGLHR